MLVRCGGDEFIILLLGTFLVEARAFVERIRALTPNKQTLSAGVVTWDGRETGEELIARAYLALWLKMKVGIRWFCLKY